MSSSSSIYGFRDAWPLNGAHIIIGGVDVVGRPKKAISKQEIMVEIAKLGEEVEEIPYDKKRLAKKAGLYHKITMQLSIEVDGTLNLDMVKKNLVKYSSVLSNDAVLTVKKATVMRLHTLEEVEEKKQRANTKVQSN